MLSPIPISLCQPTLVPKPKLKTGIKKKATHFQCTRDVLPGLRFHNRSCSSQSPLLSASWPKDLPCVAQPSLWYISLCPSLISGSLRGSLLAALMFKVAIDLSSSDFFPSNQSPGKWTPDFSPGLESLLFIFWDKSQRGLWTPDI